MIHIILPSPIPTALKSASGSAPLSILNFPPFFLSGHIIFTNPKLPCHDGSSGSGSEQSGEDTCCNLYARAFHESRTFSWYIILNDLGIRQLVQQLKVKHNQKAHSTSPSEARSILSIVTYEV